MPNPLTRLAAALRQQLTLGAGVKARRQRSTGLGADHRPALPEAERLRALQAPDGSFGQDVARTGAALLVWTQLGEPPESPPVARARAWLAGHPDALAELALECARQRSLADPRLSALCIRGVEGRMLAALLR